MDISLAKLQHLVTVARCGSFSRAASELNLSQPALSRSIAALEERYGFMFFNRLGHGVEPTAAGLQVLEQARPMLQQMLVFESNLRLLGEGSTGRLEMGMAPLMASQLVPRFAARLLDESGDIQLGVTVRPGEELLQALNDDRVELIIFPENYLPEADEIDVEPLGVVRAACIVRGGHPLCRRKRLSLDDLAAYPWASSAEVAPVPQIRSRSRIVCDNYNILRDTVLTSDLVCICSHGFVARELEEGALVEIVVEGLPLRATQIHVARLSGRAYSPLAMRALEIIRAQLAGQCEPTGAASLQPA